MKKLVTFLLIGVLLLSVVGCKKDEPTTTPSNDTNNASDSQSNDSTNTDKQPEPDKLTVWTYELYKGYGEDMKQIIADYQNENPHITIEYEVLSWAEGSKKFSTALNAGNPPDIYFSGGGLSGKHLDTGLAVPAEDYIDASEIAKYDENAVKYFIYEDKVYGLPAYVALQTWGGDKEHMEQLGFPYEEIQQNGWTWDEFYDWAMKAKDAGYKYPLMFQGSTGSRGSEEIFIHLLQNNGVPYYFQNGEFLHDDPKTLETLEFVEKLLVDGVLPSHIGEITPGVRIQAVYERETFFFGRSIPYYDVTFAKRNQDIEDGKAEGNKVEFVALPVPTGPSADKEIAYGVADGYFLFKQPKGSDEHIQNAADFLAYLTGPANTCPSQLVLGSVYEGQKSGNDMAQAYNQDFSQRYAKLIMPPASISTDDSGKVATYVSEYFVPAIELFLSTSGPAGSGSEDAEKFFETIKQAKEDLWP